MTSTLLTEKTSTDGTTTKLLLELQDGLRVESVIMRYDTSHRRTLDDGEETIHGNKRATLCVSSQVGCAMGCTFCATGTMGMIGDLTAGEILEQLVVANRVTPIRNVVFMGMGEPLNNYAEVSGAVSAMIDPQRFGLSPTHVTISTVGVIPNIIQLAKDLPAVSFALSLHAPTQELRLKIVPTAKLYPLPKLMAAVDEHHQISGRAAFVEYVMLCQVNDQAEHAHQLGRLLEPRRGYVTVNLIPWNPMLAKDGAEPFDAPDPENIKRFHQILLGEYQIPCTIRMTMGQDIDGACGQLALQKGVQRTSDPPDIEDLVKTNPQRRGMQPSKSLCERTPKQAEPSSNKSPGAYDGTDGCMSRGCSGASSDVVDTPSLVRDYWETSVVSQVFDKASTLVALVGPVVISVSVGLTFVGTLKC